MHFAAGAASLRDTVFGHGEGRGRYVEDPPTLFQYGDLCVIGTSSTGITGLGQRMDKHFIGCRCAFERRPFVPRLAALLAPTDLARGLGRGLGQSFRTRGLARVATAFFASRVSSSVTRATSFASSNCKGPNLRISSSLSASLSCVRSGISFMFCIIGPLISQTAMKSAFSNY